jgi:phosphatidate cytidylyltransferase
MPVDPPDRAEAPAGPSPAKGGGRMRDLGARVVSALLLGALALGLLYAGALPFAALILVVTVLMCWEWGHVVRRADAIDSVLVVHAGAVAAAVLLAAVGYSAVALIAITAGTCVVGALKFGEKGNLSALGVLYVGLPAVALITLRGGYAPYGLLSVLFVIVTVIATDTFAYFTGRGVGGPKLWPRVSPNKTWSGLAGGVGAAALVGAIFGLQVAGASSGRMAAIGLALGLVAQAGDLAESALKRGFGVKDASGLIPGHGGFMDRMDGLVAAAVVAAIIGAAGNIYAPAHALLLGW